jgi:hypothetical protein
MSRFVPACLALVGLSACRIEPSPGAPFQAPGGSDEPPPTSPSGSADGGRDAPGSGGSGASAPTSSAGESAGGAEPLGGACDAQAVTIDEIRSGVVLSGISVALVATASSQKFLVSQTDAGSCLWGAFVGDEPASGEARGLLVVSYGNEASDETRCMTGTDAIPDDLAPGDSVRIVGRASSFVPASCDGIVALPQLIADARCPLEPLGRTSPPQPFTLSLELADELARGSDSELVRRFAGGLVRLEDVSALPNDAGDGAVRPYGVIALAETELEVHGDIEFGDLSAGGPRDTEKGLDFPYPIEFRSVTGLVYLDYCTYSLAPRRRCEDFDPKSLGCPADP